MANIADEALRKAIGKRLQEFVPKPQIPGFAHEHKLTGARLDFVADGKKGISAETIVKLCKAADINPTYLLFGRGLKRLSGITSEVEDPDSPWMVFREFLRKNEPLPMDLQMKLRGQFRETTERYYAERAPRDLPDAEKTRSGPASKAKKRR